MSRFLALVLAVFIGGPSCFCLAESSVQQASAPQPECCRPEHGTREQTKAPKPAPIDSCHCNKCLVKRTLANDAPQIPEINWSAAPAVFQAAGHLFPVREWTTGSKVLIDTGPPHERQAIFARHCALLL